EQGRLALCRPIAGHVSAAVFTGKGTFVFTPATEIERDELQRAYGTRTLRRPFTSLVLLFSDTTLAELNALAQFSRRDAGAGARESIRDALSYLIVPASRFVRPRILKPLLDPVGGGLFYAHLTTAAGPLFFMIDPAQRENVQLLRRPVDDHVGLITLHRQEVVCQFRAGADSAGDRSATGDLRPSVEITHYDLDASFNPSLDVSLGATLDLHAIEGGQRWLPLLLFLSVRVDSLVWEDRRPAALWGFKDNPLIWVRCDPPLAAGETRRLRIRYHGRMLEREGDVFFNQAYSGWYPRLDGETPATFDLRFHCPRAYDVVAAGRNASRTARGDDVESRWVVDTPAQSVSFDIGLFRAIDLEPDSLPPIHVLLADPQHSGRIDRLAPRGSAASRSIEQRIAMEVAEEAAFFRRRFGPLPAVPLHAVETTDDVLVAYPQLVHLPLIFHRQTDPDLTPGFYRAHEMAHQWWGLAVDTRTYHDAWLSEGFADFSAAWFVQNGPQGGERYLGILGAWRRRILENRRYLFGKTTPAAPISLGDRTTSSLTEGDYDVLVYNKGAWVLHMLRSLLLDGSDPEERRFRSLMSDFYTAHAGGAVSTQEFRAAAEHAIGQDLGWFFDQWIDHAEIPTYAFSSRIERDPSGGYVVHGRVAQSNVPPGFRMEVPVRVEYDQGRFDRLRVHVEGPVTEFRLPASHEAPKRVVFNDLESVLCEVVETPWK
ncbi:MAG TPA: M1 family aminopeptidase, partial [Candidatus Udaeobacter sp.]|nr:M1 family aminopeptidase [Candidatus Udaeobacter sp.]